MLEPLVQSAIHAIFFRNMASCKYMTVFMPPSLAKELARRREIEQIDEKLRREYELMQRQLLDMAVARKVLDTGNSRSVASTNTTGSFAKDRGHPADARRPGGDGVRRCVSRTAE